MIAHYRSEYLAKKKTKDFKDLLDTKPQVVEYLMSQPENANLSVESIEDLADDIIVATYKSSTGTGR